MHTFPRRLQLSPARRRKLMLAAAGEAPADLRLTGGRVLNVFTGRLGDAAIGIAEGRVAWVRAEPGPARESADLDGATVVPGLIDAHTHVDVQCTPSSYVQ